MLFKCSDKSIWSVLVGTSLILEQDRQWNKDSFKFGVFVPVFRGDTYNFKVVECAFHMCRILLYVLDELLYCIVVLQCLANLLKDGDNIKQGLLHTLGSTHLKYLTHLLLEIGVSIQF